MFFDRPSTYFEPLLDYKRTDNFNYRRFTKDQLSEMKAEAEFYQVDGLMNLLQELTKDIEFVKFEFSGEYKYKNQVAGTQKLEDLKDKDLKKGICSKSPGNILIELNQEWEFSEIEVAGWNGNSSLWYNGNGAGAKIETSTDKTTWKNVGTIPSNYASSITTVKLTKSSARYIRFNHNSYLGLGYLFIKKLEDE